MDKIVGISKSFIYQPTVTASSAYTANDQIGALITFSGISVNEDGICYLQKLVVTDKSANSVAYEVFFFKSDPGLTSTNKQAIAYSASNHQNAQGYHVHENTMYKTINSDVVGQSFGDNSNPIQAENGLFYGVIRTTGTPTYGATTDLQFEFFFSNDSTKL